MAATAKEKFDAAVKVIQSLPKNGSYQPSYSLMLRFYGLFKQASEGDCTQPKPAFWEVVKKAKWDAWMKFEGMDEEEAMIKYVDGLKEIIETMPHTEDVGDFIDKLGDFYELVDLKFPGNGDKYFKKLRDGSPVQQNSSSDDDIEKIDPDEFRRNRTPSGDSGIQNNHDIIHADLQRVPSYNLEPVTFDPEAAQYQLPAKPGSAPPTVNGDPINLNGFEHVTDPQDSDGEEFCDTSEQPTEDQTTANYSQFNNSSTPVKDSGFTSIGTHYVDGATTVTSQADVHLRGISPITVETQLSSVTHTATGGQGSSSPGHSSSSGSSDSSVGVIQTGDHNYAKFEGEAPKGGIHGVPSDPMIHRGGGETAAEGGNSRTQPAEGATNLYNQRGGALQRQNLNSGRQQLVSGGAGGGRDQGPPQYYRVDVNEQIATALVRLQQDMNSVLTRLNTLETLSVVQTQAKEKERKEKARNQSPSWWPFPQINGRTAFFIVIWPFIAHWIIRVLANRRRRP
ncbi:unnamed protein product [Owenia fusiformis]|uniref:Uncharacterized protein n=1 Tax=Owenia fusiformis TaxID=6347 RepID=A0A8J1U807_OWEFU|nr:unnamed protein product [Owenia fusiformis]